MEDVGTLGLWASLLKYTGPLPYNTSTYHQHYFNRIKGLFGRDSPLKMWIWIWDPPWIRSTVDLRFSLNLPRNCVGKIAASYPQKCGFDGNGLFCTCDGPHVSLSLEKKGDLVHLQTSAIFLPKSGEHLHGGSPFIFPRSPVLALAVPCSPAPWAHHAAEKVLMARGGVNSLLKFSTNIS
jgi:hypothetical protein